MKNRKQIAVLSEQYDLLPEDNNIPGIVQVFGHIQVEGKIYDCRYNERVRKKY